MYHYVVAGASGYVINLAASGPMQDIVAHGLGSVPCGNPDCIGCGGQWNMTPFRWGHKSAGPSILIRPDAMLAPMEFAWSKCETCMRPFPHSSPATLCRLEGCPSVLDELLSSLLSSPHTLSPSLPLHPSGSVYLARVHTSLLEYTT